MVHFNPYLPNAWQSIAFKVRFRGSSLEVKVTKNAVEVQNLSDKAIDVMIYGEKKHVAAHQSLEIAMSERVMV